MERNRTLLAAALLMAAAMAPVRAATCIAESGARSVALLELYTSEGCNSCPPTDRWVSELPARGHGSSSVVALAFHVDYWNYLGWPDPFSREQYSERQRTASIRNRARVVYTPQLLLNGKDYRRGSVFDGFSEHLGALNRNPARAKISLRLTTDDPSGLGVTGTATVADAAARGGAQVFLVLYENDLSNDVKAGENRGKRLRQISWCGNWRVPTRSIPEGRPVWGDASAWPRAGKPATCTWRPSSRASAPATCCRRWRCPTAARDARRDDSLRRRPGAGGFAPGRAARGIASGRRGCGGW